MYSNPKYRTLLPALALSITIVLASFLWQSHVGFHLGDEGFLWYGAQRVVAGEVPMRDFYAYDIGRYYFSAAFMGLLGDSGIIALRVASAVFQAIALFIGLALLARSVAGRQRTAFLLLSAVTLAVWMPFQYRLYDSSLPLMLIGTLAWLAAHPSRQRYFVTGLIVGFAAVFGKNHGLYGALGSAGVMLYLTLRQPEGIRLAKAALFWASGVCAGYLPVLLFMVAVPGFADAFWETTRLYFATGSNSLALNIALPVPWPWLAPFGKAPLDTVVRSVLAGTFFIAILVFGVFGIAWVIRRKFLGQPASPALVASVFLALPYTHYAYSRADISHLIPGLPPLLIGTLALLASQPPRIKWPLAGMFCAISLFVALPAFPAWQCYSSQQCVEANLAGDNIQIDKGTASNLLVFDRLAGQFAPDGQSFLAAPFTPGIYAALQRKSPMWEIYALFPRSNEAQQAEIARIEAANIGFAVIHDLPLDGRDELRFRNTHPLIDQYIREHFEPLTGLVSNPSFQIFIRRQAMP